MRRLAWRTLASLEQSVTLASHTVEELLPVCRGEEGEAAFPVIEKTRFSMLVPEVESLLQTHSVSTVVLVGIEVGERRRTSAPVMVPRQPHGNHALSRRRTCAFSRRA